MVAVAALVVLAVAAVWVLAVVAFIHGAILVGCGLLACVVVAFYVGMTTAETFG